MLNINIHDGSVNKTYIDDSILWDVFLSRLHLPAIAVAVELSLFDFIKQGICDIPQLAKKTSVNNAGLAALSTLLAAQGFLEKVGDVVKLTPVSECYLTTDVPAYWGASLSSRVQNNEIYTRLRKALKNVNSAKLSIDGKDITDMWQQADLDPEVAKAFTANMHSTIYNAANNAVESDVFKDVKHLLDVGGGSGAFIDAFMNRYPDRSASIFELPTVIPLIKNYISLKNYDKVQLIPGNFFEDSFPNNCDGILLSNILHDWPVAKGQKLLAKAYNALPKGGKIFIHEMFLSAEKNGPISAASFHLLMYINHGSQQFTEDEILFLLERLEFKSVETTKTHPYYSVIVAEK